MKWTVAWSDRALKFLKRNHLREEEVRTLLEKAILWFRGERVNVNIKKLSGKWVGFHRIRKGELRVIALFDFARFIIKVDVVDWRGGAYK